MRQLSILFLIIIITCLSACSDKKPSSVNLDLIEFDVTQTYPKKELDIHDIADVSYIILEADEEYLYQFPRTTITKNFIIENNLNGQGFLFFDRTGKPVSKVYRRGDGPEEYVRAENFLYVEEEDNLYVVVWYDSEKIKVYSRNGEYKKEYATPGDMTIGGIYNYDENFLLLHFIRQQYPFGLLSKTNGEITFLTDIFIEKPQEMIVRYDRIVRPDGSIGNNGFFAFLGYYIVKNGRDFLLNSYELDTIYRITLDQQLSPVVIRKPSFRETDPMIALHSFVESSSYLFFSSYRMEYDQENYILFPKTAYLIDKNTKKIYNQNIVNKDFEGENIIIDPYTVSTFISPLVGKVDYHIEELTQADKAGKLKGKLKETYDRMDEDDEYIYMLFELK
ncbi:6-bladed beta-propeller [Parabacteroides sp. OttesenSCG-928-G07]|nr:6-bladed beta-propeller [Parabacteroides sp. OttesenSCG-928-G07]